MRFRPFDIVILLTIFANCIALAIYVPYPNEDSNATNEILVRYCFSFLNLSVVWWIEHLLKWLILVPFPIGLNRQLEKFLVFTAVQLDVHL